MSKNKKLFRIIPLVLVAMLAFSCEKDNYNEELTATDDITLAKYGPSAGTTKFISIYDGTPYGWIGARKPEPGAFRKEIVYIKGAVKGAFIPISIDESIPSGWSFVATMGGGRKLMVYNGN